MKAVLASLAALALASVPLPASSQAFAGSPQGLNSVGEGVDCFPRKVFDRQTGENVTVMMVRNCPGKFIRGDNASTGQKWNAEIGPTGEMSGVDEDGVHWRYDARGRYYVNLSTGRYCRQSDLRHICGSGAS